jgi:OOP family OmpA-OmpF porin
VDATGCPIQTDADGDGVRDAGDRCPNTPAGTPVDANGCPIPDPEPTPPPAPTRAPVILEGVTFISNSAGITGRVAPLLDRVADSLMANPGGRIEVAGHTDNRGDPTENTELSRLRAQAVVDYLVSRGVSRDRLVARGYGPDQPIADNESREGRLRNRRVELRDLGN